MSYALIMLLRPVLNRYPATEGERSRAWEVVRALLRLLRDVPAFLCSGETQAGIEALAHRGVAPRAREDEARGLPGHSRGRDAAGAGRGFCVPPLIGPRRRRTLAVHDRSEPRDFAAGLRARWGIG